MYAMLLSALAAVLLLVSSKTESSRVVTIHRPMVITQERKTPAYYVYQQAQLLQQKKEIPKPTTTYLSSLSMQPEETQIQVAEMKFTKREAIQQIENGFRNVASVSNSIRHEINNLAYENVIAPNATPSPILETPVEATTLSPAKKWATIKGKLELVDGVGIVNYHTIQLRRVQEGQVREIGAIDLNAGTYSIDIESPQGYLIAQIKDKNGLLIGEDRERLINLQSRGTFFEGPFIRIGQPNTLAANVSSTTDTVSKTTSSKTSTLKTLSSPSVASAVVSVSIFDKQNTFEKTTDVFTNVSSYTSTISRIFDPSRVYKNVVSIRHTGDKSQTPLFTSKWLEGVLSYISDIQKLEFNVKAAPVIIGRVLVDGKSASGAQVQIENKPGLTAIYLDQFMIPSFSQTSTGENGYFMFVGLDASVYNVVATKENQILGGQLFVVEDESVAFQNIQSLSAPILKMVRTFDAFSAEPVGADVVSSESEDVIETGDGQISFQSYADTGVSEFLVRSNDRRYVPIRYTQNARKDYVHLPLLQESWLAGLRAQRFLNEAPNTGVIVGFTKDLAYDSYLASEGYDRNNVVYFDQTGKLSNIPVFNGGFVLFNVPAGANEVILQEKTTDRIYSQVFNVLSQQVSVSHFSDE